MSEIVERVARAIWALNLDTDCHDYDQLSAHAKKRADEWARAVIEAMREPTEAMIDSGYEADNGEDRNLGHRGAREAWLLMIDAALR